MADEGLRAAERRWRASGAVEDEAAYLAQRVRAGSLAPARLEAAAACGHPAALAALGPPGARDPGALTPAGRAALLTLAAEVLEARLARSATPAALDVARRLRVACGPPADAAQSDPLFQAAIEARNAAIVAGDVDAADPLRDARVLAEWLRPDAPIRRGWLFCSAAVAARALEA